MMLYMHCNEDVSHPRERERKLRGVNGRWKRALSVDYFCRLLPPYHYSSLAPSVGVHRVESVGITLYCFALQKHPVQPNTQFTSNVYCSREVFEVRQVFQAPGYAPTGQRDLPWTFAASDCPAHYGYESIFSTSNSNSAASNLNSVTTHCASAVATPQRKILHQYNIPVSALPFKQSLRLPKSPEEWDEANILLSAITPSVIRATTVEEMNTILCDGIYNIISSRFGSQPLLRSKTRKPKPKQHDRALKEVTRLKNETRWALRKARREGESVSTVQSLSGKFLSLLRHHSRFKRESSRRCQAKEASAAREDCHRNFWRYAKGLLDGNTTSQTSPKFSASAAHSYFSEVYEC